MKLRTHPATDHGITPLRLQFAAPEGGAGYRFLLQSLHEAAAMQFPQANLHFDTFGEDTLRGAWWVVQSLTITAFQPPSLSRERSINFVTGELRGTVELIAVADPTQYRLSTTKEKR